MEERHIVSIDLGSSKFHICVARVTEDNVQVIYYKEAPSAGIRAGVVQDTTNVSAFLKKAIEEVENELKVRIMQAVVGLPRSDVKLVTTSASVIRSRPDEYITKEEVGNLWSKALESYPLDDEMSQIMYGAEPQSFSVDGFFTDDPEGCFGKELEGNFTVFIGRRRDTSALDTVFNSLGIAIAMKYFSPSLVAKTILSEEDRQNGIALVDVGAGVTSVAVYHDGFIRSYASFPFGGKTISDEIQSLCSVPKELAEKILRHFGSSQPVTPDTMREDILKTISQKCYKELTVQYISKVIDAQCRVIIDSVLNHIQESGFKHNLGNGIVLTGGGASLINIASLFKEMSGYDVRIGLPKQPFSSCVGTGVYSPSATLAIAMILAAKDWILFDCITCPKPELADDSDNSDFSFPSV